MEEKLKLILTLRDEIDKLNEIRTENQMNYDKVNNDFENAFNTIQNIDKEIEKGEFNLRTAKDAKILKFAGIVTAIAMTLLGIFFTTCLRFDILTTTLALILEAIIVFASITSLAGTVFDWVIEKYLIKKYAHIRNLREKVKTLNDNKINEEVRFNELKNKLKNLESLIQENNAKLSQNKEELYKLEEEFFDSLRNNDVISQPVLSASEDNVKIKKRTKSLKEKNNKQMY